MNIADVSEVLPGEYMLGTDTGDRGYPSRDRIARLAYAFYEARGRRDGEDIADWLAAEHQLRGPDPRWTETGSTGRDGI
ncbi:MAG TPA: DUF2934 domain-containing protein [Vicinamibacterales bacterium]|nr:DUF2934 domain-containing protein [Vicinamibacterales bacterium]